MKPKVPILYEDQLFRGEKPRNYGPHQLVVSCIADDLRIDRTVAWGEERLRTELRREVRSFDCFVRTLAELW